MPFFERPELLKVSLLAYEKNIEHKDFEVIVIDDHSCGELAPKVPDGLNFLVQVVTMKGPKTGVNPSLPIEVGTRVASGEFFVLTSPEVVPVVDYFSFWISNNSLTEPPLYSVFDVFALTDSAIQPQIVNKLLDLESANLADYREDLELSFLTDLGEGGYSYANKIGAWYQHHSIKNNQRHFLAILAASTYFRVGGFNLSYRRGAGYEDDEFLGRLRKLGEFHSVPGLAAVHLNHQEVSDRAGYPRANSNSLLFQFHAWLGFSLKGSKRKLRTAEFDVSNFGSTN